MADPKNKISLPSDSVLDDIPVRALKFFGAVSSNAYIRATLDGRGYSEAIHERGWELVLKASGFRRAASAALARPEAAAAIAELDAWDEPNFRVARAALLEMPDQLEYVFDGLEPQKGVAAVASITTFLDRLDALQGSKERKATRIVDQAALDKLAERRIGPNERTRLRGLLAIATASPDPGVAAAGKSDPAKEAAKKAEQREAKIALWMLLTEWSENAKADIQRRDHLIQLGIAKRKVGKTKKAKGGEETPAGG